LRYLPRKLVEEEKITLKTTNESWDENDLQYQTLNNTQQGIFTATCLVTKNTGTSSSHSEWESHFF
jgi:hypothetical protein